MPFSNHPQAVASDDALPKTSTNKEQHEIPSTSSGFLSFQQILPVPKLAEKKKRAGRQKQHAKILTATPLKQELEENEAKKQVKEKKKLKVQPSKKNLDEKRNNLRNKRESHKRKLFDENSSDSDVQYDDNEDEYVDEDICLICNDYGKNNEQWYRCTLCGRWAHSECSGWDTPVGYTCDECQHFT